MQQNSEKETIPIATRITGNMKTAILLVLETDAHVSLSDYLRDLIRKDLESRGFFQKKIGCEQA